MLDQRQFDRVQRLALRLAGMELAERHRELLDHRSRHAGLLTGSGLNDLLAAAEAGESEAQRRLISLFTTNVTGFFRHPAQFRAAAEHALGTALQGGTARLWSAAAATGEEPYSLAITLMETSGREDPGATILATDIDREALAVAEVGEYAEPALRGLAPGQRSRFFQPVSGGARWRITRAARQLVSFREVNLTSPTWPTAGPFDVILSRNVLMYFEAGHRLSVVGRMAELLAPGGLLILDPVEHLGKAASLFTQVAPGVYRLKPR